ncbi:diiron oxygenase [Massilia sp. erpn]|uniref:diiron oxygenase n=1 Tax=Massilia sp. erpn TaxID=2738142 RepID=UPI00210657EC|nr:diiron oxygenase [Massilia sp. erpn]UTY57083.1 hypothetical protein HPQ68_07680 [Massilia sp. erpn]
MNNPQLLKNLVASWSKRAAVRHIDMGQIEIDGPVELPDYPFGLLPFHDHPLFLASSESQRKTVLTLAWLAYNMRVIHIEEQVTNPAIAMILKGDLPGASTVHARQALQQTQIDEQFHLFLHEIAIRKTMAMRDVVTLPVFPDSVIYRELIKLQDLNPAPWQHDLLTLIWAAVSEMTINAYLELLAEDKTIQPSHSYICRVHNRDEYSHNKIFVEITKVVFSGLNEEQRQFFLEKLPMALDFFAGQDFSVWHAILEQAGIASADQIIADIRAQAGSPKLISDTSAARNLIADLNEMARDALQAV